MKRLPLTPSQTVGPFFHDCMLRADACCDALASASTEGVHVRVEGRVLDGDGTGLPDAVIETWQANHRGRYNHPADGRTIPLVASFAGFGRIGTDASGHFAFTTVKPGAVPYTDGRTQAPHVVISVFARGLLNHLVTRMYFEDESSNVADPVLLLVPDERRSTLIARRIAGSPDKLTPLAYQFDIILQGSGETVFFDHV
jgi:protocatechuate 3,4-dioxygenase, alpha subunit